MRVAGTNIAFIGTGVMGSSMAQHLHKAGAILHIYNRTKEKANKLIELGAIWEETPAKAVAKASVVFTMLGYPDDVRSMYLGKEGIIKAAPKGCIFVDQTTSDPLLAEEIAQAALAEGKLALDAPVSGGDTGAKNATLSIMVGGDKKTFDEIKPFFDVMGKTSILQGGPGAGQHTKMANQISVAASLIGSIESMIYSEKAGLNPSLVLDSIGGGAAMSWQLVNMSPRMLAGNFEPGFYSKHFLKDLKIAINAAESMKINLPLLTLAKDLFEKMQVAGYSEKGTQALYQLYKESVI